MNLKRKGAKAIALVIAIAAVAPMLFSPASAFAEETQEIKAEAASIEMTKDEAKIKVGNKKTLKVTAQNVEKDDIKWSSSNKKVATVSKKGVVTAKKKGKAVITASVKGTDIETDCEVTVERYKVIKVKTTAYCNCRKCNGQWANGPTYTGVMPKAKHTIAVDPKVIPLGSKVIISGVEYKAEDTGGAIKGNRIDIFFKSHKKALAYGVKYKKVKVYY